MVNYTETAANCLLNACVYTHRQKQLPALARETYPYDEQHEHRLCPKCREQARDVGPTLNQ